MRILLWNCNNGISHDSQIEYFNSFSPDVAIIPEIKKTNISKLNPSSHAWVTNNFTNPSPKGLGILAFNGFGITELERDEEMEIFIPVKIHKKDFSFNLLAVWNFYTACKQGRFKGVKGVKCLEYSALEHYKNLLSDPCLVAGDWNLGPTFAQDAFLKIVNILEANGLKSLYHKFNNIPLTESLNPTFRSSRKTLHHLDHMFGSKYFYDNILNFKVEPFEKVILSDHAPLIVELNTNGLLKAA